jgi:hypothetical protein
VTNEPVIFDRASAELLRRVVREELGKVRNTTDVKEAYGGGSDQWVPFVNDSSTTVPAFAIMRVSTGSTAFEADANGNRLIHCNQASTAFTRVYAVNAGQEVPSGGGGLCALSGAVDFLGSTVGAPVSGDMMGPVAGSWSAAKYYPATLDYIGTVSSTGNIFHGTLAPISMMIAKTTGAYSTKLTATTGYRIFGGSTQGAETQLDLSVPSAVCRTTIATGIWIEVRPRNDGYEIVPLACTT